MPKRAGDKAPPGGAALRRLARAWGVQTSYIDYLGAEQSACPEAVVAVLRSLGAPIESPGDAGAALAARQEQLARRISDPVVVAWDGETPVIPLNIPAAGRPVRCTLKFENGAERRWESAVTVGADNERARLLCEVPGALDTGAHHLRVESGDVVHEATILSAPSRCYGARGERARELGVFLPLYSVRSRRNWGVGDLTDLAALADWAGDRGASLVGALPMLAAYLDEPFDPSPYAPVSRLFWNELYLDPAASPDLAHAPEARAILESPGFIATLTSLRRAKLVDYRRVMAAKRRVLEALAASAFSREARRSAIDSFLRDHPAVDDYARFRAATEQRASTWRSWPESQRDGRLSPADFDETVRRYYVYAQFLLHEQLETLSRRMDSNNCSLYLDLPVGAHADGFDTWRYRGQFLSGLSIGAPPDALFSGGQNWGLPPLCPDASRADGHAYFTNSVRTLLRYAGALRIDHVMGLHRLFLIPDGFPGADGVYVSYPADELYAALSIESHRRSARIVGENLGTVPEAVNRSLARRGVLKMFVMQFALNTDEQSAAPAPPRDSLASLGTHDTPTFAGLWEGRDIDLRVELGLIDAAKAKAEHAKRRRLKKAVIRNLRRRGELKNLSPEPGDVLRALLRLLAASPADAALVTLEDLWLETAPQNVPGIADGQPNWRRKSALPLDRLTNSREINEFLDSLKRLRVAPPPRSATKRAARA